MSSYKSYILLSVVIFIALYPVTSYESTPPVVFTFGDSNSDTGEYAAVNGITDIYPQGRLFTQKPSGRASDGRLVIDFLCGNLSINFVTPFLFSFYQNYSHGCNFAYNGTSVASEFGLNNQMNQFKLFQNNSIDLHSKGRKDLLGVEAFRSAIYVLDIGQNDLPKVLGNRSHITTMIQTIKHSIMSITQIGGRKFWVHNTGPFGCLPGIIVAAKPNSTDLDEYGCIKNGNEIAKVFNQQLKELCDQIVRESNGSVAVVYVDVYMIKYKLISNAISYGFENPLKSCSGFAAKIPYSICPEGSRFVSFDGYHYTEAANNIVALGILSTEYSTPPVTFDCFSRL